MKREKETEKPGQAEEDVRLNRIPFAWRAADKADKVHTNRSEEYTYIITRRDGYEDYELISERMIFKIQKNGHSTVNKRYYKANEFWSSVDY